MKVSANLTDIKQLSRSLVRRHIGRATNEECDALLNKVMLAKVASRINEKREKLQAEMYDFTPSNKVRAVQEIIVDTKLRYDADTENVVHLFQEEGDE